MNSTYDIIRIENGTEVPLAGEMPGYSLGTSMLMMVLILIIAAVIFVSIYLIRCYSYRSRIRALRRTNRKGQKSDYKLNWNLFRLRDIEEQIKSHMVSSIQVE